MKGKGTKLKATASVCSQSHTEITLFLNIPHKCNYILCVCVCIERLWTYLKTKLIRVSLEGHKVREKGKCYLTRKK